MLKRNANDARRRAHLSYDDGENATYVTASGNLFLAEELPGVPCVIGLSERRLFVQQAKSAEPFLTLPLSRVVGIERYMEQPGDPKKEKPPVNMDKLSLFERFSHNCREYFDGFMGFRSAPKPKLYLKIKYLDETRRLSALFFSEPEPNVIVSAYKALTKAGGY